MLSRHCLLAACVIAAVPVVKPEASAAPASKLAFWNTQRKGANGGGAEANDAWFAAAARTGIEFVRLSPANMRGKGRDFLLGNADRFTGIPAADFLGLKRVLDTAQRHRVKVVLTMFGLPGARWKQQNGDRFDYRLWTDAAYHEQSAAFWRELAGQLKDHPAVVGYDLLNEPHPERKDGIDSPDSPELGKWLTRTHGTAADLDRFNAHVVNAVREVDPHTPIILESRFHGHPAGFRSLAPLPDPAVLYSFHFYHPWEFSTFRVNRQRFAYPQRMPRPNGKTGPWTAADLEREVAPVREWAARHRIPANRILVGEIGCDRRVEGAQQYLSDVIRMCNRPKWHWAFYSFRSPEWDGMDYELGTAKLSGKYWAGREAGKSHESLIRRGDNPLWRVFTREFRNSDK